MLKSHLDSTYLLDSELATQLYEQVSTLPVLDYFTRLNPSQLQKNQKFEDINALWLFPDPLKNSLQGDEKGEIVFSKWVSHLKYQLLHPVYAWSHLELFKLWGFEEFLRLDNAPRIYNLLNEKLKGGNYTPSFFIQESRVESLYVPMDLLDPLPDRDSYAHLPAQVYPIFSPIQVLIVDSSRDFNDYLNKLSAHTSFQLDHYIDLLNALHHCMDLFAAAGCRMAHHRLELMYAENFTQEEVNFIFHKIRLGHELLPVEKAKYRSALLFHLGEMYFERNWIQQYYLGTIRKLRGQETGFDAMGDDETAWYLLRYLHEISGRGKLPKTLFYHPNKSSLIASIASKFNAQWGDGYVQARPAWEHMTGISQMEQTLLDINFTGHLENFVGMPSSAYAFPSLMRHDFFKRRVCSFVAGEARRGYFSSHPDELLPLVRRMVSEGGISYFETTS